MGEELDWSQTRRGDACPEAGYESVPRVGATSASPRRHLRHSRIQSPRTIPTSHAVCWRAVAYGSDGRSCTSTIADGRTRECTWLTAWYTASISQSRE